MLIDLDNESLVGPNPPPWEIHYVNDKEVHEVQYGGVLPEARTIGLEKICGHELVIRLVSPNIASPVLDTIGIWLLNTKQRLKINDQIKIFNITFTVMPLVSNDGLVLLRLSWQKDPPLSSDQIISICQEHKCI